MTEEIKEINLSEMLFNRDERLLDYITNLQQEINKLTAESTEWESKYYDLQQENEDFKTIIKQYVDIVLHDRKVIDDYKSRCEKAIEYIKTHYLMPNEPELENILNGSGKE